MVIISNIMKSIISQQNIMLVFIMLAMAWITAVKGQAGTRVGFYSNTCSQAEFVVRTTVERHFQADPTIAPGLLRMHFHDCFSQGCDASVLIDGPDSERTAPPNHSLRGFEVIDDAKSQLEDACPGVISCADILALAARDSVFLTNGPFWEVPTGRRDSRVSNASDAKTLPGPRDSVAVQKQKFSAMGLNTQDLVTLVGGHTIGTTACGFFSHRLSNFTTSQNNDHDPKINPAFLPQLQEFCPQDGEPTGRVGLDFGSESSFDTSFFLNLRNGRGVLESDQMLWTDNTTRVFVQRLLRFRGLFNREFARAMVKMSRIGVKTGRQGEIRRVCSAVN